MAYSYSVSKTGTTNYVGHKYTETGPSFTHTRQRFFTRIDLTGYTGSDVDLYGPTEDGSVQETETGTTGDPVEPTSEP